MEDKDDPTRILDGWRPRMPAPPQVAPPELDLSALHLGQRGGPSLDAERIARLKKRGFSMTDIEDVEVPEIRLPAVEAPVAPDLAGIGAAMQAAATMAQEEYERPVEAPQSVDTGRRAEAPAVNPRLLASWRPGVWSGVRRRVMGASTGLVNTPEGPLIENHAPLWLLAAWPPQSLEAPLLGRWPEQVLLCAEESDSRAAERLLAGLPESALLWVHELEVDWALLAELVLHQDPSLKPEPMKALRELAEAERLAVFERMNSAYAPATAGQPVVRRKPPR